MNTWFYTAAFIASLLCSHTFASENKLVLAASQVAPFAHIDSERQIAGLSIDIATHIATELELELEVIFCPWVRCLNLMEKGQADISIGLVKTPARNKKVLYLEPAIYASPKTFAFFTLKNNIKIESYADLKPLAIGMVRGVALPELSLPKNNFNLVEVTSVARLVTMLKNERIDTLVHSIDGVLPVLKEVGLAEKVQLHSFQKVKPLKGYIVLSRNSHIAIRAEEITATIQAMLNTGHLGFIYQKYGISNQR